MVVPAKAVELLGAAGAEGTVTALETMLAAGVAMTMAAALAGAAHGSVPSLGIMAAALGLEGLLVGVLGVMVAMRGLVAVSGVQTIHWVGGLTCSLGEVPLAR
jgi:hypothetical protein